MRESCFCGEGTPTIRMGNERSGGSKDLLPWLSRPRSNQSFGSINSRIERAAEWSDDRKKVGTLRQHRSYGTCAGMQRRILFGTRPGTIAKDNNCKVAVPSDGTFAYPCIPRKGSPSFGESYPP